ncbi:nicotinate-nucleotide adenylyltransferase [Geojedonia litorea]|uniref:Nicotinate-nucleotide adenylyltransferase n=1 Tax=Geojedonia litorea TaxID=1268269 RepID=A0ABV9MZX6_9FLAO
MKNFVIGLFLIGLTSLGFSQNKNEETEEVKLEDVVVSTNVNLEYLSKVQDKTMSEHVKSLENEASRFDVKTTDKFDGRRESFKTIFRGTKGYIIATYDKEGKIIKTSEKYKDIKLPVPVRNSLFIEFPDWDVDNTTYVVSYYDKKDPKKVYKVEINKKNNIKTLKIDSDGTIKD